MFTSKFWTLSFVCVKTGFTVSCQNLKMRFYRKVSIHCSLPNCILSSLLNESFLQSVPKKDDLIHIPFVKLINSFKLPILECDCIDPISLYYFHWICWAYYAFNWNSKDDSEEIVKARCHYRQAEIDGRVIVNLNDDAHVKVSCYWMCFWC